MRPEGEGRGRFVPFAVGAIAASVVWILIAMTVSSTPGEARARRESPTLPPPSAVVVRTALQQVTWYECFRDDRSIAVHAGSVGPRLRPVVTYVAKAGAQVRTGTVLARVADRPLVAVRTDGIFYRDLKAGDEGPDVAALKEALFKAKLIDSSRGALGSATVEMWRTRFDRSGLPGRIDLSTLVAVPPNAVIANVQTSAGQDVASRSTILEVGADSETFGCDVPDPAGAITPATVKFQVDGRDVAVSDVVVRERTSESPGRVEVQPSRPVRQQAGQLGVVFAQTTGKVLAVPISAIRVQPDGDQGVEVLQAGARRVVPVTLGVTAQGLVEVEAAELRPGMRVVLFDSASQADLGSVAPSGTDDD